MATTPKKSVQWALTDSPSELGSLFSNTSSESATSTSSIQYINAQLIAHGFTSSPGLCLDGISNSDSMRVVKCLFGMLSQRMEDMSRTEELNTKLRTLSYDHERLMSMHRVAVEKAANAEREMNLHKSRLEAANRTLQSTKNAHKQTTAELQRTRTSVIALRTAHHSELKKKEKDAERMVERWAKLSDTQARLGTIGSGMRCTNAAVVEGPEVLGKGQNFLETALEEAENERSRLSDEATKLRHLVLNAVNEAQSALHLVRSCVSEGDDEEPPPLTLSALFPFSPSQVAHEKMASILSALRESLSLLSSGNSTRISSRPTKTSASDGETEKLQAIITSLRSEIEQAHQQSAEHAAHTQALFDRLAEDNRNIEGDIREMSVDLMTVPAKDEEAERLEGIKRQLDEEREKFTQAAIQLGRQKAALEAERIKLLDEKRTWQVEIMLAELPPTPNVSSSPTRPTSKTKTKSPCKSPRKSPGKVISGKKTRVSRRSSLLSRVIPSYETEVLPPLPAPFTIEAKAAPLLTTSFVLPPPSPLSSLPSRLTLLAAPDAPEVPIPDPPATFSEAKAPPSSVPVPSLTTPPGLLPTFQIAKPHAPRMIHAYSPAKPSPLSRILMLAHSPQSPDGARRKLEGVAEQDEEIDLSTPSTLIPPLFAAPRKHARISESDDEGDNPLQEKKVEANIGSGVSVATAKGRVHHQPDAKRFTAAEKGKAKVEVVGQTRPRPIASGEKENDAKRAKVSSAAGVVGISAKGSEVAGTNVTRGTKLVGKVAGTGKSKARVMAKLPGKTGGARRVPVDSAEAGVSSARARKG